MRLEAFLDQTVIRNVYLDEPEWHQIYVRQGPLTVYTLKRECLEIKKSFQLANFEAKVQYNGAFTQLISRVERASPDLPIFVENLFNESFSEKIISLGFEEVFVSNYRPPNNAAKCFLKRCN